MVEDFRTLDISLGYISQFVICKNAPILIFANFI